MWTEPRFGELYDSAIAPPHTSSPEAVPSGPPEAADTMSKAIYFRDRFLIVSEGQSIPVGRSSARTKQLAAADNFFFDNPIISRRHASIYVSNGNLYLKDVGSTHGTSYCANDLPAYNLKPGVPQLLCDKATIHFGTDVVRDKDVHKRVSGTLRFYEGPPTPPRCPVEKHKRHGFGLGLHYHGSDSERLTDILAECNMRKPAEVHVRSLLEHADDQECAREGGETGSRDGRDSQGITVGREDEAETHVSPTAYHTTLASKEQHVCQTMQEKKSEIHKLMAEVRATFRRNVEADPSEVQVDSSVTSDQTTVGEPVLSQLQDETRLRTPNELGQVQCSAVFRLPFEEFIASHVDATHTQDVLRGEYEDAFSRAEIQHDSVPAGLASKDEVGLIDEDASELGIHDADNSEPPMSLNVDLGEGFMATVDEENISLHWDDSASDDEGPSEYDIHYGSVAVMSEEQRRSQHEHISSSSAVSTSDSEFEDYCPGALVSINQAMCTKVEPVFSTLDEDRSEVESSYGYDSRWEDVMTRGDWSDTDVLGASGNEGSAVSEPLIACQTSSPVPLETSITTQKSSEAVHTVLSDRLWEDDSQIIEETYNSEAGDAEIWRCSAEQIESLSTQLECTGGVDQLVQTVVEAKGQREEQSPRDTVDGVGQSCVGAHGKSTEAQPCVATPAVGDSANLQPNARKRSRCSLVEGDATPSAKRPRKLSSLQRWQSTVKNTAFGIVLGAGATFLGLVALGST